MLNRFFAGLSGMDFQILDACRQDKLEGEYHKATQLGLLMPVLASLSGAAAGYAVFTVSSHLSVSIAFGIFWGILIFLLDRYLIASWELSKSHLVNLLMTGSRVLLALLIGFLVSYPAELAIFQPEIEAILMQERTESNLQSRTIIKNNPTLKSEREALGQQKQALTQRMQATQNEVQRLYDEFKNEAEAKGGTMKYGYGPVAKQKEQRYLEFKKQADAFNKRTLNEIEKIDAQLEAMDQTTNAQLKAMDEKQAQATGLLARASALHRLMKERPVVAWIKWGVTLILLLLECIPVFAKLFSMYSSENAYQAKAAELKQSVLQKARKLLQSDQSELQQLNLKQANCIEEQRIDAKEKNITLQQQAQCVRETRREDHRRAQELADLDLQNEATLRTARLQGTLEEVGKQKEIDQIQLDLALAATRQKQALQECNDRQELSEREETARQTLEQNDLEHQARLQQREAQLKADLAIIDAGKNQAMQNMIQMQNDIFAQVAPLQVQAQIAVNAQAIEKWRQEQEALLRQNAPQFAQVA